MLPFRNEMRLYSVFWWTWGNHVIALEIVHFDFGMTIATEVLSPNLIMMIRTIKGITTVLIHFFFGDRKKWCFVLLASSAA